MSTVIDTMGAQRSTAREFLGRLAGALKHAWDGYCAWRIQEATIACLRTLSDRQLEDIGLARSQIDCAVRGALRIHPNIVRDC